MRTAAITNETTLGLILREARIARGLTQRELAAELGVDQRYVVELEAGKPTKALQRVFAFALRTGIAFTASIPDD